MTDMTAPQTDSNPVCVKISKCGRLALVKRTPEAASGVWVDVVKHHQLDNMVEIASLDGVGWPDDVVPVMPKVYAMGAGAGRGVRGGAAALKGGF